MHDLLGGGSGLQQAIQRIAASGTTTVVAGTVEAVEAHQGAFGALISVRLHGEGGGDRVVQCRLLQPGGNGSGFAWPVDIGSEVVCLLPAGDINAGLVIQGRAPSKKYPLPDDLVKNTVPTMIHPDGLVVKTADGAQAIVLVRVTFLDDFANWLSAIDVFISALAGLTAPPLLPIVAAATALQAQLTSSFGSPTGFTNSVSNPTSTFRSKAIKSD